jgi:hypothetical protein
MGFLSAPGLGFAVGPCVAAGAAELDCAVPDPEVFAAGVAESCATPHRAAISNPNKTTRRPHRSLRRRGEKSTIIPLYAELDAVGTAGESLM